MYVYIRERLENRRERRRYIREEACTIGVGQKSGQKSRLTRKEIEISPIHCSRMWDKLLTRFFSPSLRHMSLCPNPGNYERLSRTVRKSARTVQRTIPDSRIPYKSPRHAREILSVDTRTRPRYPKPDQPPINPNLLLVLGDRPCLKREEK